jgi:hypothetical protein
MDFDVIVTDVKKLYIVMLIYEISIFDLFWRLAIQRSSQNTQYIKT